MSKGAALLMEMGCGKTLTAIAAAGRGYLNNKLDRLLVICPTSVMAVWVKEFEEYADFEYTLEVLEGSMQQRTMKLKSLNDAKGILSVAVINYEATWRLIDELLNWNPDMVICDESQRIKNHTARQSKAIHKLGAATKYKMILSGTPVQNSPLDLFSQYRFLDESIFGTSYYLFRTKYAKMGGYGGYQVIGYNNLDDLIKRAHSIAYRVTKDEALDLPDQVFTNRYCSLETHAMGVYEEIRKENYTAMQTGEITTTNVLTRLLRLCQITGGWIKNDMGIEQHISNAKLDALQEVIDEVVTEGSKKLVIFARFISEIKAIKALLEQNNMAAYGSNTGEAGTRKLKYVWISGEVNLSDRGEMVRAFQEDADVMVFIAQIQTAGLGITLTAAHTAVFYSLDYNYSNYSQAISRIHRIGQKEKCTYIHLLAKDTVDEKILDALGKKEDIAKSIVDNWRQFFGEEKKSCRK